MDVSRVLQHPLLAVQLLFLQIKLLPSTPLLVLPLNLSVKETVLILYWLNFMDQPQE